MSGVRQPFKEFREPQYLLEANVWVAVRIRTVGDSLQSALMVKSQALEFAAELVLQFQIIWTFGLPAVAAWEGTACICVPEPQFHLAGRCIGCGVKLKDEVVW